MPAISKCASIVYRFGQMYFDEKLAPYHIGSGQQFFLLHIYRNPGISQEELASFDRYDKGTTARAVKKLEDQGYILRRCDEKDRRFMKLYVTQEGEAVVTEIYRILNDWNAVLNEGLDAQEQKLVSKLMEKIAQNADRHIGKK